MITINKLHDLKPFGIIALTGEAGNLGFRLLCDLTETGRRIVAECYGLNQDNFPDSWNPGNDNDPHVASIMLPFDAWSGIGIIALLQGARGQVKCHSVITTDCGLFGLQIDDCFRPRPYDWNKHEYTGPATYSVDAGLVWRNWPTCYGEIGRVFSENPSQPHIGTRNMHAMSGRAS